MDSTHTNLVEISQSGQEMAAATDNKPLHIFNFPREVRDMIWGFVVIGPGMEITVTKDGNSTKYRWPKERYIGPYWLRKPFPVLKGDKHPDLDIFRVCRQTYEEAMLIYYSKNTFVFCRNGTDDNDYVASAADDFLKDRPEPALQYIKHINLQFTPYRSFSDIETVTDLVNTIKCHMNLRHLSLKFAVPRTSLPYMYDPRVYRMRNYSDWPTFNILSKIGKLERFTFNLSFPGLRCFDFDPILHSTPLYRDSSTPLYLRSPTPESDNKEPHDILCSDTPHHCDLAEELVRGVIVVEHFRSRLLENGLALGTEKIRAEIVNTAIELPYAHFEFRTDNNSNGECLLPKLKNKRTKKERTEEEDVIWVFPDQFEPELPDFFHVLHPTRGHPHGYVDLQQVVWQLLDSPIDDIESFEDEGYPENEGPPEDEAENA